MDFYFTRFEHRQPPEPLKTPRWVMLTWQVLAVASLILGANYIYWRWTASLNTDALWYAIPLVLAETLAWIGTVLFTINLWKEDDPPQNPPRLRSMIACAPKTRKPQDPSRSIFLSQPIQKMLSWSGFQFGTP